MTKDRQSKLQTSATCHCLPFFFKKEGNYMLKTMTFMW